MTDHKNLPLPPPSQLCVVVKDLEKTVNFFERVFGISLHYQEAAFPVTYREKAIEVRMKAVLTKLGTMDLEIFSPVNEGNVYSDYLASGREGIQHMAVYVDDFAGTLADLATMDIKPIQYGHYAGGEGHPAANFA